MICARRGKTLPSRKSRVSASGSSAHPDLAHYDVARLGRQRVVDRGGRVLVVHQAVGHPLHDALLEVHDQQGGALRSRADVGVLMGSP
jgi:hypothetical protein